MIDFLLVFCSFLLATFLMGRVIRWCHAMGLVDGVTKRSAHKNPTPTSGGIIIVLFALIMGIFHVGYLFEAAGGVMPWYYVALLGGGALVALVGLLDDRYSLSAKLRLCMQVLSVLPALCFLPPLFTFLPSLADKALILLLWMWMINAYNFMDGIDGLAGAQAVFVAAAISLFSPFFKPLALVIAGSSLGFLRVNISVKRPAKIFMGDVGSTFLGFMFAGFIFYMSTPQTLLIFLSLMMVFLADTTYTLVRRFMQGKKLSEAHKEHLYQRAVHVVGMSHTDVVRAVTFINIALLIVVFVSMAAGIGPWALLLALGVVAYPAYRLKKLEG